MKLILSNWPTYVHEDDKLELLMMALFFRNCIKLKGDIYSGNFDIPPLHVRSDTELRISHNFHRLRWFPMTDNFAVTSNGLHLIV